MEVEIAADRVLLSAYGAWHFVLNHSYLPHTTDDTEGEAESDAWDREITAAGASRIRPLPEPWRSRMTTSWECIFDVVDLSETNTIQACFEELRLTDVLEVKHFDQQPGWRTCFRNYAR